MEKKILTENIDVENIIYDALKKKIGDSINYNEMHRVIEGVVESRRDELQALLNNCLDKVLADKKFRDVIVEEFRHKVAKNLVAKLEGAIEKNVNKFRADPILNARMITAVEAIINEHA